VRPSRVGPVVVTSAALGLINIGVAVLIVGAIGADTFAPLWVGAALLVAGVLAAVGAVVLWRRWLHRHQPL
jgi:hypothetical protein